MELMYALLNNGEEMPSNAIVTTGWLQPTTWRSDGITRPTIRIWSIFPITSTLRTGATCSHHLNPAWKKWWSLYVKSVNNHSFSLLLIADLTISDYCLFHQITANWPKWRSSPLLTKAGYGSKVQGADDEESDLGLLVALPLLVEEEIRQRIIHKVFELNLAFGSNISVLIVSRNERETGPISILPIHDFVEEEGIALWVSK